MKSKAEIATNYINRITEARENIYRSSCEESLARASKGILYEHEINVSTAPWRVLLAIDALQSEQDTTKSD